MQIWLSLAIAAVTGAFYGFCFPPYRNAWLAWVVLTPVLIVSRSQSTATRAAAMTGLFSFVGMAVTVDWLPQAVSVYYQQPVMLGVAMFVGIAFSMVVPWVAAYGAVDWLLSRRPNPLMPLLSAATWVSAELARSTLLTGNPWVLLGYSQAGARAVTQIADLAGVYGVSFVLAASGATLADAWLVRDRTLRPRLAIGAVVIAATLAYGSLRLHEGAAGRSDLAAEVEVGLVQGNLDRGSQWFQELYGRNLEAYGRSTLELLKRDEPRLVIWPEGAVTFFFAEEALYRRSVSTVLEPFGATLLSGGPYREEDESFYNSAFVLGPDGEVRQRYDKEKLLPFMEYFPIGDGLMRRSFGRVRQFTARPSGAPLTTPAGRAGVLICNEAMFPELARRRVRDGAELLVVLSNDTWVGDEQFSAIAADMSILRAVEQRRYLVRVSTAGPSWIIDPWGRATSRTATATRAIASGVVRPSTRATVYARLGDTFALGCLAAVVLALLRERKATRS